MENNSDITLCIDGNFFVYSRLHVMPKPKKSAIIVDGKVIGTQLMAEKKEMTSFIQKLAMDFASEIRKFQDIVNRVVFVVDSKSWRKDYDDSYKANRSLDDSINWKNVFDIMKTFEGILEDKGVIVEQISGAEGDDMLFAWSTYLNSIGEDFIMWTGDKDLLQLVNYNNSTGAFTLWYDNTRHRIGVYPGFDKWLNIEDTDTSDLDFLDMMDDDLYLGQSKKQLLKNLIEQGNLQVDKIFCDEFAFIKILTGDKGDNVESVILKPSKKGDKFFKVSEKKALEVLNLFKKKNGRFSSTYLFNESYKEDIVKFVKEVMDVNIPDSRVMANLERNINLMLLHVETIPDAIQRSMFDVIKEDHLQRTGNFARLTSNKLILEGTEYEITNKPRSISGPPKNIKGLF